MASLVTQRVSQRCQRSHMLLLDLIPNQAQAVEQGCSQEQFFIIFIVDLRDKTACDQT